MYALTPDVFSGAWFIYRRGMKYEKFDLGICNMNTNYMEVC